MAKCTICNSRKGKRKCKRTDSLIWNRDKAHVNDRTVQRLVEMLLDRYHFNEEHSSITDPILEEGFQRLNREINKELENIPTDQLVKVLGAVYRSIQRRSGGGCSYLQFINNFTGGQYMV